MKFLIFFFSPVGETSCVFYITLPSYDFVDSVSHLVNCAFYLGSLIFLIFRLRACVKFFFRLAPPYNQVAEWSINLPSSFAVSIFRPLAAFWDCTDPCCMMRSNSMSAPITTFQGFSVKFTIPFGHSGSQ